MTFPICSSRTAFDGLNHTSRVAATSMAGASAGGDGPDQPVRKTQDGKLLFQPQAPATDFHALLKTAHACFRGVTGPLQRFAAGLMRSIGPVAADAALVTAPACEFEPTPDSTLEQAIARVSIAYAVEPGLEGRLNSPQARQQLVRISANLRNALRLAAAEHADTAELIEQGLRNIAVIKVVTPEALAILREKWGMPQFSGGAYKHGTKTLYVGHFFEGKHAATCFIHEFSHVREFRNPDIETTREYDADRIEACQERIKAAVFEPVERCLHHGDLSSKDCVDALAFEPAYRARAPILRCHTTGNPDQEPVVVRRIALQNDKGRMETTLLAYLEVGETSHCMERPFAISRKGGPRRANTQWEARLASMLLLGDNIRSRAFISNFYPPHEFVPEFHASFVETIPRQISRQLCPELFTDRPL